MSYLLNKDGTKQEISVIYSSFTEEGGFNGKKPILYKEPMSVVQLVGVDIRKPWSIKTVPTRFIV